jgi:hypothetical protein
MVVAIPLREIFSVAALLLIGRVAAGEDTAVLVLAAVAVAVVVRQGMEGELAA